MTLPTDQRIPPDQLITEHSGGISRDQFIAMGDEIVTHSLIGAAKLQPSGRLLDIGCGCGKIARPLTRYLSAQGGYDGIDITSAAIDWCRQAYKQYPNFRFHLADLQSTRYNSAGAKKSSDYRFPFEADSFDVTFLGSVFTHLLPEDTAHYLREIARVLKPGGRCLATFFVLDAQAKEGIQAKKTTPTFGFAYGDMGCRIEMESMPEAAIAYEEDLIRRMHEDAGLAVSAISFGEWGRKRFIPHWQDEVWSYKR